MSTSDHSSVASLSVIGFVLTGAVALFSATLAILSILGLAHYTAELNWVGKYIGAAAFYVGILAFLFSQRRNPLALLAGVSTLYLITYSIAGATNLGQIRYFILSLMLVYGVTMLVIGVLWRRQSRVAAV